MLNLHSQLKENDKSLQFTAFSPIHVKTINDKWGMEINARKYLRNKVYINIPVYSLYACRHLSEYCFYTEQQMHLLCNSSCGANGIYKLKAAA
jgi:hypothetical protein